MKRSLVLGLFVLNFYCLFAQKMAVGIGETVPEVTTNKMFNYKKDEVSLSDFKGKLLILDFWATWCQPCVASFPKIDSLQKKFGSAIQILPVTREGKDVVNLLFEKRQKAVNLPNPATVINDNVLWKLFLHTALPHYVWINGEGQVVAITDGKELTSSNIQAFLNDKNPKLPVKVDQPNIYSNERPLFVSDRSQINLADNEILFKHDNELYTSVLARYTPVSGNVAGLAFHSNNESRITAINVGITQLFQLAYSSRKYEILGGTNRVIHDIKDSSKFIFSNNKESKAERQKKTYSYEISWKKVTGTNQDFLDALEIMKKEMNGYFKKMGIQGGLENRTTKMLVLVRTDSIDHIKSKSEKPFTEKNPYYYKLAGMQLTYFIADMMVYLQKDARPIKNLTGYRGKVDIEISCDLSKIDEVNKELKKFGLQFIEKDIETDMIVIKQN